MKKIYILGMSILMLMGVGCSSQFEREFKTGCKQLGGKRSFCSCTYDKIEAYYGKDQVKTFKNEPRSLPKNYNAVVESAAAQCFYKNL